MDHKLLRWHLPGNRHHFRRHLIANLERLGKIVAPRVASAMWGLVWNRWCTRRRFQSKGPCILGCGNGEDSIEHYIGCAVGREVGSRYFNLHGDYAHRKLSLLGARKYTNETEQACWAILAYGIYMTTNARRHHPIVASQREVIVEQVIQHCRQASEGHSPTCRLLRTLWRT